jgi:hypothetical protein
MFDHGNGRVRSHPLSATDLGPLTYPGRLLLYCGKKGTLVSLIAIAVGASAPWLGPVLKPWMSLSVGVAAFGAFLSASYSLERSWLQPYVFPVIVWSSWHRS